MYDGGSCNVAVIQCVMGDQFMYSYYIMYDGKVCIAMIQCTVLCK